MPLALPDIQTVGAETKSVGYLPVPPDSMGTFRIEIFATNHLGEMSIWFMRLVFRRVNGGVLEVPAAAQDIVKKNTTGMAGAAVVLAPDADALRFDVTGVAGLTIDWRVSNEQADGIVGTL
jgi:hypothetical protein